MKNSCGKLNELLEVEIEIIQKHLEEHKWFQHIEDENVGTIDFVEKYGWLMKEMYCGLVCAERHQCLLANHFKCEEHGEEEMEEMEETEKTEKKVTMVEIKLELEEETVAKMLQYARENIVNDRQALINWGVTQALKSMIEKDKNNNGHKDKK